MENVVSVPVSYLERLKSTLTTAFYQSQASDLLDSYRSLSNNVKWSPMTSKLSGDIELLQNYIDAVDEDEEVEINES